MRLYPFLEIISTCELLIQKNTTVFQQWLCQHCGTKQTMADPNHFYTNGKCEECGKITNIVANGCNYMAVMEFDGRKNNPIVDL